MLYNPMDVQKHSIINQGRLCSTIFNRGDSALVFPVHPCLGHFWVQSEDCMTWEIQGLVDHPYLAHVVRYNLSIVQLIQGLLCKAQIPGLQRWFTL